jgi:hypothetical protein
MSAEFQFEVGILPKVGGEMTVMHVRLILVLLGEEFRRRHH